MYDRVGWFDVFWVMGLIIDSIWMNDELTLGYTGSLFYHSHTKS